MTSQAIRAAEDTVLQARYDELVSGLPTRSPIFLPTEKVPLAEKLTGVRRVKEIYDDRLDRLYRPRLRALREQYKDRQRCFIIGNGPSLNLTDLAALKDEVTFAVNGFFLKANDLDWLPTFYVVEDHLVAEDRSKWINRFKGPTKLFPAYLAYCLDEGDDTIFFNHRPRVSYPKGFDFSLEADKITYAGCTVTFTCMQLAAYLGFKEIYLIGVDASYDIPKDVQEGNKYGVGVLDMKSDDPNHFHPDYFGKGFRWHDPQVEKMVAAYTEARRVLKATPQQIYNATFGGKLEVFERRLFTAMFPSARSPDEMEQFNSELAKRPKTHTALSTERDGDNAAAIRARASCQEVRRMPRLLLIDITAMGDGTATGEVKQNLLSDWNEEQILQVCSAGPERIGTCKLGADIVPVSEMRLAQIAKDFNPEIILYRPVPDNRALHSAAMKLIRSSDKPLVTWIMDDWPSRLVAEGARDAVAVIDDLRELLHRSCLRLSIGDAMSEAFEARYGVNFTPFANGVDPNDWPMKLQTPTVGPCRVRYAGSLADNMTLDSVARVAHVIESLATDRDMIFEIKTREIWHTRAKDHFAGLVRTRFITDMLRPEEYRAWVRDADIAVIAYNFDAPSQDYVRYSMANKMPECLASGAPVLAHGPRGIATIDYLAEQDCVALADDVDEHRLAAILGDLAADSAKRTTLAGRARNVAFANHNLCRLRAELSEAIVNAADSPFVGRCFQRSDHAHLDETKLIDKLIADQINGVMLDVGAHFGSSARTFADRGWRVYCFEPDPANRQKLKAEFSGKKNVTIDPRAVGESCATEMPFFASDESTGISSVLPFTSGHKPIGTVEMTTVTEIVDEHAIERVDFLKIDVEGLDFNVIKGVPWGRIEPLIIECEFGTADEAIAGYAWKDIADFLVAKGYTVFVSEWHPQLRFGIRHDWFGLKRYPCKRSDADAWGNLLAFKNDPGDAALSAAVADQLRSGKPIHNQLPGAAARRSGALKMTWLTKRYRRFAGWVRGTNPTLFRLAQSAKRSLLQVWKVRHAIALAIALLAALVVAPLLPMFAPYRSWLWSAAALLALAVMSGVGALAAIRVYDRIADNQARANEALRRDLKLLIERVGHRIDTVAHRIDSVEQTTVGTTQQLSAINKVLSKSPVRNAIGFQHFNRHLTKDHIAILGEKWLSVLKLESQITPKSLSYLAYRIGMIESVSRGRLATNVEDAVLRTLVASAVADKDLKVLEIGTLFGMGLAIIHDYCHNRFDTIHLTALDPLEGYYGNNKPDLLTGEQVNESNLSRNLAAAYVAEDEYRIIKRFSTAPEALREAEQSTYNLLVIDGDHTYNGVAWDYRTFSHLVAPGGYIIIDDYGSADWPDIKKFVDEEVLANPNLDFLGASWRTAVFRVKDNAGDEPA